MGEDVLGLLLQLAFQGFILEVEPQRSGGWCAGDPVSLLVDWQRFTCWLTGVGVVVGQYLQLLLDEQCLTHVSWWVCCEVVGGSLGLVCE